MGLLSPNPRASGLWRRAGQPMRRARRIEFSFPASSHITSEYGYLMRYDYLAFSQKMKNTLRVSSVPGGENSLPNAREYQRDRALQEFMKLPSRW
jgi:hypothetical protein